MKTVKFDLSKRAKPDQPVHDGVGGVHAHDSIAELPDDVANEMIALGCAFPVDGSSLISAKQRGEEKRAADMIAQQKARAVQAMRLHDNLPAEVREAVHEFGDEATESYLAHQQETQASEPFPDEPPQRRHRRRR